MNAEKAALVRMFLLAIVAPAILALFISSLELSEAITSRIVDSAEYQNAPAILANYKGIFGIRSADAKLLSVALIAALALLGSLSLAGSRKEGKPRAIAYASVSLSAALGLFFLIEWALGNAFISMLAF